MKNQNEVKYQIPDWAKPSFETRFHEHIQAVNQLSDVSAARLQQISLQGKLQEVIPPELYPLLLEYEGAINERTSLELQYLYWIGIRDGLKLSEVYRGCIANQE
ncbi:hypothetical protein [Paenibacillus campinasensis]|uniref:Uncharacterized protein n=1 Tax=Paenibacillus campinasensis TaxID=66347 RepID=A0A268ETB2_9BACL|nr:hypothetical protein [Paenibacillus campinasensis]PAD76377.1 hypothetical protein CHH67_12160 [Paenibacillus campinasensis]